MITGFMPAESKEVLTGVETGVSEVQGDILMIRKHTQYLHTVDLSV